jgi:aspartate kinase
MSVTSIDAPIVVQKYGGSSVATAERIVQVAERVIACRVDHPRLVVAVSAMGKTTDQLVSLARQVSGRPHGREYDLLLAAGEQIAVSLLALALQDKGTAAIALTGAQSRMRTDSAFNRARIQSIDTTRILEELARGRVVVIAGFQGVTDATRDDLRPGRRRHHGRRRGGVEGVGANLHRCDGVLSADPNLVPGARLWPQITYEEAIEMASSGAKVLHPRAAEICMNYGIPIHVRSSFHHRAGTWIRQGVSAMEQPSVVGVTGDKKIAKVTLFEVPDRPGIAAEIFKDLADREINIRLIIQSASNEAVVRSFFIVDDGSLIGRGSDSGLEGHRQGRSGRGHMAKIAIVDRGFRPPTWRGCSRPWQGSTSTASARRR